MELFYNWLCREHFDGWDESLDKTIEAFKNGLAILEEKREDLRKKESKDKEKAGGIEVGFAHKDIKKEREDDRIWRISRWRSLWRWRA